jgi:hypothetical protein
MPNNSHAYFPALITSIAFADLLSGVSVAGELMNKPTHRLR